MSGAGNMIGRATVRRAPRKSAWPARLDFLQSLTGFLLAAFLAVHLLLDSAILFGPRAADAVAQFFEGRLFFGSSYPWIVSAAAVVLLALVVAPPLVKLGLEGEGMRFPVEVSDVNKPQELGGSLPVIGTPINVELERYLPDMQEQTLSEMIP